MGKIADTTRHWSLDVQQRKQIVAFDQELSTLEAKAKVLEAEKLNLEQEINPLKREVDRLKKQIEEQSAKAERATKVASFKSSKHDAQQATKEELNEHEIKVLQHLARLRLFDKHPPDTEEVAKHLGVNEIRCTVILRSLQKRQYIWFTSRIPSGWLLNDKGEEFLVEHGMM